MKTTKTSTMSAAAELWVRAIRGDAEARRAFMDMITPPRAESAARGGRRGR
jgi:hypothetical protein